MEAASAGRRALLLGGALAAGGAGAGARVARAAARPRLPPPSECSGAPEGAPVGPECWGARAGALGTCEGVAQTRAWCASSADDRPAFFLNPYEFSTSTEGAAAALVRACEARGGTIMREIGAANGADAYVWAYFANEGDGGTDVEWVFVEDDDVVDVRALTRGSAPSGPLGAARNELSRRAGRELLNDIRLQLGWTEVPIIRNRQRALFFVESPLDTFGPEPPPSIDYGTTSKGEYQPDGPLWNAD